MFGKKFILNKIQNKKQPGFIIIGSQKAGTSSLFFYLNQHQLICGSEEKELSYFSNLEKYALGDQWYLQNFKKDKNSPKSILFEATPEYLYYRLVPERIYQFNSSIKLIVVLREPIERAFSSWNMFKEMHSQVHKFTNDELNKVPKNKKKLYNYLLSLNEFPEFRNVIKDDIERFMNDSDIEEPSFVRRGIYYLKLKRYLELFNRDQILILGYRDLIDNTVYTLNKVLTFLDLPKSDWKFLDKEIINKSRYTSRIDTKSFYMLKEFYSEHNEQLFDLLQERINW